MRLTGKIKSKSVTEKYTKLCILLDEIDDNSDIEKYIINEIFVEIDINEFEDKAQKKIT